MDSKKFREKASSFRFRTIFTHEKEASSITYKIKLKSHKSRNFRSL